MLAGRSLYCSAAVDRSAVGRAAPVRSGDGPAPTPSGNCMHVSFLVIRPRKEIVMARHHRNLDDWEAEHGITMGHTHPPVHHNAPETGSLATVKTVTAKPPRRSGTASRDRQKKSASRRSVEPVDTAGNGPVTPNPTIARGIRQPYSYHQFGTFPVLYPRGKLNPRKRGSR
jgi:hypothetical protein